MEFDVKIYQLSSDFQKDYPTGRYPELMCKKGRPYSCLLVDLHQDYFICIPYRSSIQHNNAFLFGEHSVPGEQGRGWIIPKLF